MVKIGEAGEIPYIRHILGNWPFEYGVQFFRLCSYHNGGDAKADEIYFFCGKLTLTPFHEELRITQALQHCFNVLEMLSPAFLVHDDVVHVHFREMAHVIKNHINVPLEGTRRVVETKRHDQP